MRQTNVQRGPKRLPTLDDLTGKRSFLVKMSHATDGSPAFALPTAANDPAIYVVTDDNVAGKPATADPLNPEQNARVIAKGTGAAGGVLVLADPVASAGVDKGKVRALPATAGTYVGIGIAEEPFVDGQAVLFRPWALGPITVS